MAETESTPAIVAVGSLHYDIVLEAPDRPRKGETLTGEKWYPKFGGKGGNQAVAAAKTGVETRFVGAVGDDDFAKFMLNGLKVANISTSFITTVPSHGTGMSVAIMDSEGDYGAVIVSGANLNVDPNVFNQDQLWNDVRLLVLQNEIPENINVAAALKAKALGITVCLNAAPSRKLSLEFLNLIDILIVNAIEAEDMCGVNVSSLSDAEIAASAIYEAGLTVIVTAGGDGVAVKSDEAAFALRALPVDVVSTHGAGDMFVGTLCGEIVGGKNFKDAVIAANEAAAVHVSQK